MEPPQSNEFYAFRHRMVCTNIEVTVCRFCGNRIAYSPHPNLLIKVEEHHTCPKMREFLNSIARRERSDNTHIGGI
jgi:hypothetical protein